MSLLTAVVCPIHERVILVLMPYPFALSIGDDMVAGALGDVVTGGAAAPQQELEHAADVVAEAARVPPDTLDDVPMCAPRRSAIVALVVSCAGGGDVVVGGGAVVVSCSGGGADTQRYGSALLPSHDRPSSSWTEFLDSTLLGPSS